MKKSKTHSLISSRRSVLPLFYRPGFFAALIILLLAASARADIVILKSGRQIFDVKVTKEGPTYYLKGKDRSWFISKDAVESIVRTEKPAAAGTLVEKAESYVKSIPGRAERFVRDEFVVAATAVIILAVLLALLIFKFIWINMKPLLKAGARRRDIIDAARHLDADEKAVMREFFIQQSNAIELPVGNTTVSGLIEKGVLVPTQEKGEYSACGLMLPVIIAPAAKRHIKARKIGMPADMKDEKKREAVLTSRPEFIYEMARFYKTLDQKPRW